MGKGNYTDLERELKKVERKKNQYEFSFYLAMAGLFISQMVLTSWNFLK